MTQVGAYRAGRTPARCGTVRSPSAACSPLSLLIVAHPRLSPLVFDAAVSHISQLTTLPCTIERVFFAHSPQ